MPQTSSEEWQLSVRGAETYDDVLVPAIFAPWVSTVLDVAQLSHGQSVLDVACGTGIVAEAAMTRVGNAGSVAGLDLNPAMLQVALRRRNSLITWTEGDVHRMPFATQQFDRIICQLGLQYFDDPATSLAEMYRLLKPEGYVVLMLWRSIEHSPGFAVLADLISEQLGSDIGESMRAPFAFGDDEDGLRALLIQAGFRQVTISILSKEVHFKSVSDFVHHQLAASPLGSRSKQADTSWIDSISLGIVSALGLHDVSDAATFPIEAYVARAQRWED